jgi:hypothetical protein
MPQIAKPITSLDQELELRIEWLEKGLKEILDCCDLKYTFVLSSDDAAFAGDVKDIAQSSLDGEPTTADEYNAKTKLELEKVKKGLEILKKSERKISEDNADKYNDEEDVQLGASIVKSNDEVSGVFMSDGKIKDIDYLNDKNTVSISDINKEIAKEWNRDREERINKEKTK